MTIRIFPTPWHSHEVRADHQPKQATFHWLGQEDEEEVMKDEEKIPISYNVA